MLMLENSLEHMKNRNCVGFCHRILQRLVAYLWWNFFLLLPAYHHHRFHQIYITIITFIDPYFNLFDRSLHGFLFYCFFANTIIIKININITIHLKFDLLERGLHGGAGAAPLAVDVDHGDPSLGNIRWSIWCSTLFDHPVHDPSQIISNSFNNPEQQQQMYPIHSSIYEMLQLNHNPLFLSS